MPGAFNPLAGPVTRHLFPSFFNCTPAETDVGTRLAGPARCGDLFVRARRAGCHRSGRATAAVRWPRCASLLRYARFARRILCPAGFLVALVFSRSKNASSNSSLVSGPSSLAARRPSLRHGGLYPFPFVWYCMPDFLEPPCLSYGPSSKTGLATKGGGPPCRHGCKDGLSTRSYQSEGRVQAAVTS